MTKIKKVAVIGSGVMGSGIAAQVANADLPVVLLDIKLEDKDLAKEAVARMLKTNPAPFMHKSKAKLITTGNLDDDLDLLKDCDWIIEVVIEDIEIKHVTYQKLQKYRKKGSIVSSNTSTIPLHKLVEREPDDFAADFLITHFFNPPRYMRLMELIIGEKTHPDVVKVIRDICDVQLGKGVVQCNDTPGFIANRLGVFWLTAGINEAIKAGISIDIADAVMSRPVGIPKTGVFGLIDLIGVDLMPKLSSSLLSTLPEKDAYRDIFIDHPFIHQMIDAGYTGRKGKGGFYRLFSDNKDKKIKQSLNLSPEGAKLGSTFTEDLYIKSNKSAAGSLISVNSGKKGLKAVVSADDEGGHYAWNVLSKTLIYAASLVGEIADTIFDIDEAMKLGYNWKQGPFEMIDALGAKWFAEKLIRDGIEVPELITKLGNDTFYKIENGKRQYFGTDGKYHNVIRSNGVLLLHDIKLSSEPVMKNDSASIWDISDGVLCFEHTSKMNIFNENTFAMIDKVIKTINDSAGKYRALVIYNEALHFSAGADLEHMMLMINTAMYSKLEEFIKTGQKSMMALKYAPFPVISAPSGMALGGGCEVLLTSDAIQAHSETYTGLVEVGVGIIPTWGGCKEMILRFQETDKQLKHDATTKAFEIINMATITNSAADAKAIGYFRENNGITMNRDRLLYDAKQRALELSENYCAPDKIEDIRLSGESNKVTINAIITNLQKSGKATPYDIVVANHLAHVFLGGENADLTNPISEDDLLKLELEQFSALIRKKGTLERIKHMLEKGKPLRN
ncbi:MAG: enoyl-CoA hydratase/isomerase family protein [Alphaproteobacteria bacterium]|nr:enoyl-CoA hydratase/isomerase family protein [Alphaproteobacteria bacterium]